MRKLTSILTIAFLAISVCVCAQNAKKGKVLVAYFSASGNTEAAAKKIQEAAGAELYKIEPEKPYTKEDLDFRNRQARSVVEMGNPSFREKLGGKPVDIKKYDVIYLGFPIWANKAPSIIYSFLESQDFKGKTIIPFATSGSSPIDNSVNQLKAAYPELTIQSGKRMNNATDADIKAFVGK